MKKTLFKYLLILGVLCCSSFVSANTASLNNVLKFSNFQIDNGIEDENPDLLQQDYNNSYASIESILEIRIVEVEIEESFHCLSKKASQNSAVNSFSLALLLPFHIHKKEPLIIRSYIGYIPNKQYITYQVFRI